MDDEYDDMHEAEAERQARLLQQRLARWRDLTPPVFRCEGVMDPRVAEWSIGLAEGKATNLVLIGDIGSGKTWHAYAAVRMALEHGYADGEKFMTSMGWRRAITPPVNLAELEELNTVGALILDDMGAIRMNDWDRENLLEVINARWSNQLPSVVTSNVSDLRSMVGERIASRLADDCLVVALKGPDLRREGK